MIGSIVAQHFAQVEAAAALQHNTPNPTLRLRLAAGVALKGCSSGEAKLKYSFIRDISALC